MCVDLNSNPPAESSRLSTNIRPQSRYPRVIRQARLARVRANDNLTHLR